MLNIKNIFAKALIWENYLILICLPIIILVRLIRPIILIRFGCLNANGIGDMIATYLDYDAKDKLGLFPKRRIDLFFSSQENFICNIYLFNLLFPKKRFTIHKIFYYFWRANLWFPDYKLFDAVQPNYSEWPAFQLKREDHIPYSYEVEKDYFKSKLGIRYKYVCMHSRDDAYKKHLKQETGIQRDIDHQKYRNSRFKKYELVIGNLYDKGIDTVRVGNSIEIESGESSNNWVTYCDDPIFSPENDINIFKGCEFWVMTNTGYTWVPQLLGKPGVACNLIPFTPTMLWHYPRNTMVLPKQFFTISGNRLSPRELLAQNVYNHDEHKFLADLNAQGITYIENSDKEINATVMEYFAFFEGKFENVDRNYQKLFWDIFYPEVSDKLSDHIILPSWYIEENI